MCVFIIDGTNVLFERKQVMEDLFKYHESISLKREADIFERIIGTFKTRKGEDENSLLVIFV
jgi:hypothetical protein